jgi:hypothetical protein
MHRHQTIPSCRFIFMKSKLFHASTIFPSLTLTIAMPSNSTGAFVALKPRLSPVCLPRTLQRATFSNHVLDIYDDIGKRAPKLTMELLKGAPIMHGSSALICQTVNNPIFDQKFIDNICSSLVPHFFEPPFHQCFVLF